MTEPWRLVNPPIIDPAGDPGHLHEIAAAACQLAGDHPELWRPAVTIDGAVKMISTGPQHPTAASAAAAAEPAKIWLKRTAAAVGFDVYDDITAVTADIITRQEENEKRPARVEQHRPRPPGGGGD